MEYMGTQEYGGSDPPIRPHMSGQRGFTLPLVMVMTAISLVANSSITLLARHFRSITIAQDGASIYDPLDAAEEAHTSEK